jgi:hypothetical protein
LYLPSTPPLCRASSNFFTSTLALRDQSRLSILLFYPRALQKMGDLLEDLLVVEKEEEEEEEEEEMEETEKEEKV